VGRAGAGVAAARDGSEREKAKEATKHLGSTSVKMKLSGGLI
jgi:hypothetical protein